MTLNKVCSAFDDLPFDGIDGFVLQLIDWEPVGYSEHSAPIEVRGRYDVNKGDVAVACLGEVRVLLCPYCRWDSKLPIDFSMPPTKRASDHWNTFRNPALIDDFSRIDRIPDTVRPL